MKVLFRRGIPARAGASLLALAISLSVAQVASAAPSAPANTATPADAAAGRPARSPVAASPVRQASTLAIPSAPCNWPLWNVFANTHVQNDGRVVDFSTPTQQSTSEGQAYALFFALVNNDRAAFDRVLGWTEANLAGGDLRARLPAWQWGRAKDGSYTALDRNSASDADTWLAYTLFEAGRLWREPSFLMLARAVTAQIEDREVADLPGFGPMLLPGENGFQLADDVWRLNPSYLPLPVLRLLALQSPDGPWRRLAVNAERFIVAVSPKGFAPDWAAYQTGKGFVVDPVKGDVGSYDAIRVYLWAGITSRGEPLLKPLLAALGGMNVASLAAAPPEKVATLAGGYTGAAPVGFSAALLPYYKTLGADRALVAAQARVASAAAAPGNYYDNVLTLFGQGWLDGRYRLDGQGRLTPRWGNACQSANAQ
ncbi:MAG: cellulose synthase complex periplasmic endoglucanase BcsZ [Janthinobacterium lividum]